MKKGTPMKVITWHGEGKTLFYVAKLLGNGEWEYEGTYPTLEHAENRVRLCGYCAKCGEESHYDSVRGYCWYHHREYQHELTQSYFRDFGRR